MVGSEYHGGTGTEGIVSSSIVALVSAASCVASRLLVLVLVHVVRGDGGRPRLAVLEVLNGNAKATKDALALLAALTKRRDDKTIAATSADGHGQQQRKGAMVLALLAT